MTALHSPNKRALPKIQFLLSRGFKNNNEGSIPFTRSIDYEAIATQCSKSAVSLRSLHRDLLESSQHNFDLNWRHFSFHYISLSAARSYPLGRLANCWPRFQNETLNSELKQLSQPF